MAAVLSVKEQQRSRPAGPASPRPAPMHARGFAAFVRVPTPCARSAALMLNHIA